VIEDVADFGWVVRKVRKHGIAVVLHQHAFTQRNYRTYLWKRIERELDKIIFVSEKTLELTERKHGKLNVPSSVIYNGVDLEHYDPQKRVNITAEMHKELHITSNERVIIFVGRLAASKGILQALKAYLSLGRKDIHFLIIGGKDQLTDPVFYQELNFLITKAVAENFPVKLFENVSQADIPYYYALADYILVPSTSFEGLPKVITEALAMGVPVIASDRGGIWELLQEGKNGWKIKDPVCPATIRSAIEEALSVDDDELKAIKQSIINLDRPKMDQQRMVRSFQEELNPVMDRTIR
jgi:glycosyltransferase involved in cell wall biosynthesis